MNPFPNNALIELFGKTFIVPGWVQVPNGTKLEDVKSVVTVEQPTPARKPRFSKEFVSSSGNKYTFSVTHDFKYDCTCPGFTYHKTCRHRDAIRDQLCHFATWGLAVEAAFPSPKAKTETFKVQTPSGKIRTLTVTNGKITACDCNSPRHQIGNGVCCHIQYINEKKTNANSWSDAARLAWRQNPYNKPVKVKRPPLVLKVRTNSNNLRTLEVDNQKITCKDCGTDRCYHAHAIRLEHGRGYTWVQSAIKAFPRSVNNVRAPWKFIVTTIHGNKHTLTLDNNKLSCSCGFPKCEHVAEPTRNRKYGYPWEGAVQRGGFAAVNRIQ